MEKALHEMKEGELRSGSGAKVSSRKQAIAIGLSEAREEGAKVPKKKTVKKKTETKKKSSTKKTAAEKKAAPKKTAGKKHAEEASK